MPRAHRLATLVLAVFSAGPSSLWLAGQSALVPGANAHRVLILPEELSPTEVFTTTTSSLVIKAAADADYRSLYSWVPGGSPKLIARGRDLDVARLSDDRFAAWSSENNRELLVTLSAHGLSSAPILLPPGGPTGWQECEGNIQDIVCLGNLPTMSVDDKDYDEMGFTAVMVIDLARRKTSWFPVGHQTYFHFDSSRSLIYVADPATASMNSHVKTFDLAGGQRANATVWDMSRSPSGRFADSLQEDGSESWEIYDVKSKKQLLAFNCESPLCKTGDRDDSHHWNPVFSDQFVALQTGGAYGKGGTCDVYQAAPPRMVKRIRCEGLPVFDWSRDGRELITIKYEGGEYRRIPVNGPNGRMAGTE